MESKTKQHLIRTCTMYVHTITKGQDCYVIRRKHDLKCNKNLLQYSLFTDYIKSIPEQVHLSQPSQMQCGLCKKLQRVPAK